MTRVADPDGGVQPDPDPTFDENFLYSTVNATFLECIFHNDNIIYIFFFRHTRKDDFFGVLDTKPCKLYRKYLCNLFLSEAPL